MGEDIACRFLVGKGFEIVDRNYQKKWGELDIVAQKGESLHFFEVKSVMKAFRNNSVRYPNNVTSRQGFHRPEDNVHGLKVRHLRKIIQTYMDDKMKGREVDFHFHVLCVFMDTHTHIAHVEWINDVIL